MMKISELMQLYPTGEETNVKLEQSHLLTLRVDSQKWFQIPKQDLAANEQHLLQLLFPEDDASIESHQHPWFQYLFNHTLTLPKTEGYFRVLQIQLKQGASESKNWLTHLASLFQEVDDFFFIDDTQAIIIEKQTKIQYQPDDIEGMLLTLESEFLIQAKIFIGSFHLITHQFNEFFNEEQVLFKRYHETAVRVFSFQDVALDALTHEAIDNSMIMQEIKVSLQFDEDLTNIIKTLWEEQGNITSAAKKLFIHRNTLQYRLDKFYDRTGLSLKKMNDLTLCYLLIH